MKSKSLNELRQVKTYGYKSKTKSRLTIKQMIDMYQDDETLGREIRKAWKK